MDQNRDWKLIAALVLGGLAIFIALRSGRDNNGYNGYDNGMVPQQIIVQPVVPVSGTTGGTTAPVAVAPAVQPGYGHVYGGPGGPGGPGGWRGGGFSFPFFPLLFLGGIIFLAFRVLGPRRHGWGGPGWYGGPPNGPGPGPQAPPAGPPQGQQPYQQYPPQYAQGQGQSQSQPPASYPQGEQPQQGQPTQAIDPHGDMTRPEGSRDN